MVNLLFKVRGWKLIHVINSFSNHFGKNIGKDRLILLSSFGVIIFGNWFLIFSRKTGNLLRLGGKFGEKGLIAQVELRKEFLAIPNYSWVKILGWWVQPFRLGKLFWGLNS